MPLLSFLIVVFCVFSLFSFLKVCQFCECFQRNNFQYCCFFLLFPFLCFIYFCTNFIISFLSALGLIMNILMTKKYKMKNKSFVRALWVAGNRDSAQLGHYEEYGRVLKSRRPLSLTTVHPFIFFFIFFIYYIFLLITPRLLAGLVYMLERGFPHTGLLLYV